MPPLNRIIHTSPHIQKKVNFFADYFEFVATYMGILDALPLENSLSIIDKVIFQLEYNLDKSIIYVDNYFASPYFTDNDLLKNFPAFNSLQLHIRLYHSYRKTDKKIQFIKDTPKFLNTLKQLQEELKAGMIKTALAEIISYLGCTHELEEHKESLKKHTRILVSEFLLNEWARKPLLKVFDKIISSEINTFPFPKNIKSREKKATYLKSRTFNQQFEGIINLLQQDKVKGYFLYRVFRVKLPEGFKFKYNTVTFYNKQHSKIQRSIEYSNQEPMSEDFFSDEDFIVAAVQVEYTSLDIAQQAALDKITKELSYLNLILGTTGVVDPYHFLFTRDFKKFGWRWDHRTKGVRVDEFAISNLKNHPYRFLRFNSSKSKTPLLKHEHLYIQASTTRRISDYWQYLETLLPKGKTDKQVKEIFSYLLLLTAEKENHNTAQSYLRQMIGSFSVRAEDLGVSIERQNYLYRNIEAISYPVLLFEIKHTFVQDFIKENFPTYLVNDYRKLQRYYYSIILEAYEQRNAFIHRAQIEEKANIKLQTTLDQLVKRFRWILFAEVKRNKTTDFNSLIEHLLIRAKELTR